MNLAGALRGLRSASEVEPPKHPGLPAKKRSSVQTAKRLDVEPGNLPLQGIAKSKHPQFAPVTIYVRKATRTDAWRKWEDAQGGDFSDLVQMLLEKYLEGR